LALNSCTAALHTALKTLGIGPGDEVITTPMTFTASVNVIEHVGARPVLVDVEPDTLNIDPRAVEAAITRRTRAILPVHYAGHPANLDPLRELADAYDLALVEDAAHALPACYKGRPIGSEGNPVAFSFYATKNLTTGEGGMLTADPDFLARARVLSLHGMSRDAWKRYDEGGSWFYEVLVPGFKYNMTDIQAALGLWQLRKLEQFQQRRRAIVSSTSAPSPFQAAPSVRNAARTSSTPALTCSAVRRYADDQGGTASSGSLASATPSAHPCTSFRFTSTRTIATSTASSRVAFQWRTAITGACSACHSTPG
jgi:dTDP-4-amino-4,6-dideoxygalactose transaminase